jgi:peptidoglycan hydrolase CwlO-like protein
LDAVTTVTMASEVANSQVVWSILCIGLTVYVLWNGRQEKRELLNNLNKLSDALTSQAETMKDINDGLNDTNKSLTDTNKTLEKLEGRIDSIERNSYNRGRGGE